MRNLSTNSLANWLAVLLVSSVACVKASFDPIPVVTGGAGAGGSGGAGGQIAGAGGGAGGADSGTCPETPVLGCTPTTTDPCDPVCQTGSCNWCTKKCSYTLVGATAQATCAAIDQSHSPAAVSQPCGVTSSGTSGQYDNCVPGSICLQPVNGGFPNTGYCFALCHNATYDCNGVACTQRSLSAAGGLVNVCDPYPYSQCGPGGSCCDPFAQSGSCGPGRYCLLVAPNPSGHSRTVCEFSSGDGSNGAFCASAHDCKFANTCVNDGLHNGCHRVCNAAQPCPVGGGDCLPWGTEYGFCSTG